MASPEPNSRRTLAVLFGASSYRRAPKLAQGRSFYNSAQDFYEYLIAVDGLNLPRENINWLFDDSRSPGDQLQDIRDFLENRSARLRQEGIEAQDLVLFYVGHGLFWGPDHIYSFAVRATDEGSEGLTSIRASDLATIIKAHARFLRKFLILDCCFSAAAYKEFQSGPLVASHVKLLDALPQRGTTLLCSASAKDPSLAPAGLSRTMFSNGLLKALGKGHASLGERLSLSEVGDLVRLVIREEYPDIGVRPEIHSPDQREGDVGSIPLFPNPAYFQAEKRASAERTLAGAEAEKREESARLARVVEVEGEQKAAAERARMEKEARRKAEAPAPAPAPQVELPPEKQNEVAAGPSSPPGTTTPAPTRRTFWIRIGAATAILAVVAVAALLPRILAMRDAPEPALRPVDLQASSPATPATSPPPPSQPEGTRTVDLPSPAADHESASSSSSGKAKKSRSPGERAAAETASPSVAPAPPVVPAAPPPEVREAQERWAKLDARASSAFLGVQRFRSQQQAQGLVIRGDILEAMNRARQCLSQAHAAISSRDLPSATAYMNGAEVEIARLEKFLAK